MICQLSTVPLMPARHHGLVSAIAGLKATGVPLVGFDQGRLFAVGVSDNAGLYLFVSLIARATGLSPDAAATLFFYAVAALALVVGGCCWWLYARGVAARVLGIGVMLVLTLLALHLGDSYVVLAVTPLACVPPLLLLWRRGGSPVRWGVALFGAGLAAGMAGLVRAEAAVIVGTFAAVLSLTLARQPWARRALQVGLLVLGVVLPVLGMRALQLRRDAYLARAVPGYEPPPPAHAFWHPVYVGLGFLSNEHGLDLTDESAQRTVQRLAPGAPVYSGRYNAVLRSEVLRLVRESPAFVARTLFAKLGIVLMYLLVFGNVGLLAAARFRKPAQLELPFAATLLAAALPGVLIFPILRYMEGFTALVALYALVSVEWALAARRRTS